MLMSADVTCCLGFYVKHSAIVSVSVYVRCVYNWLLLIGVVWRMTPSAWWGVARCISLVTNVIAWVACTNLSCLLNKV